MRQLCLTMAPLLLLLLLLSPVQAAATTCNSVQCVTLAAEMVSRMNMSADPCQDFYNYACGNFPNVVKYNPLRTSATMNSQGDTLFEDTMGLMSQGLEKNIYELLVLDRVATSPDPDMADLYNFTRLFYRSCRQWVFQRNRRPFISEEPAEDPSASFLRGVVDHLNETLIELSRGSQQVAMETVLAALVKTGGVGLLNVDLPEGFATVVIQKDDLNLTQTPRARVDIDMVLFPVRLDKDPTVLRLLKFLDAADIGAPQLKFGSPSRNDTASAPSFLSAQTRIKQASEAWSKPVNCSGLKEWKLKYTIAELDNIAACAAGSGQRPFSWRRFFNDLLQARVDPSALVEAYRVKEVTRFVNYMKSRPVFDTAGLSFSSDVTFLVFDWLLSFQQFFPSELQMSRVCQRKPSVVESPIEGNGVVSCMLWTKTLLQPILERMYQTAYHRQDFADVKNLVKLIQDAAIASVNSQPWITSSAKKAIAKKIESMKQTIGLDELSAAEIKAFYASTLEEFRTIELLPNQLDAGFGSLFSLGLCAYAHKNFDVMSGLSPVTLFMEISPLVVNAFNWVQRNQIIFPMAILAPPYYHPTFPEYVNLGSLGYVIGHEIGHSFDNIGHTVNQQGANGHFWDNVTESRYLQRMECVRRRYGSYLLYPGGPLHLSNSTLGNDIADIIGIRAATAAWNMLQRRRRAVWHLPNLRTDLSPEQVLFVQAAQSWCVKSEPGVLKRLFGGQPSHSPHHLRVRGIAENSPEFAVAFKCPPGRPMNPEDKCTFW